MENKKTVSALVETSKKRPMMLILSLILLVGLVAFALYLYFSKSAIQEQQNQLDQELVSIQTQIDQLKQQNVEGAQFAQQWLAEQEKQEVRWSKVIKGVQDILPVDSVTLKPKIVFSSYSGSTGGKLTLNAQTAEGSVNPFADVADLISTFNNSSYFKDAYVPSINHGISQAGNELLSFVFNVTYAERLPDVLTIGDAQSTQLTGATQQTTNGTAVKVPRNK